MMKLSSRAYDLYEAFEQPGCPVCRLTLASVHQYLDSLIYEYVNKPATHAMVRAARGFCPRHGWHVENELNASAFAIALLYEGLVRTLLKDMGDPDPNGGRRQVSQAGNALAAQAPCPACEHQATVEEHLLRNLLEHIGQAPFAERFDRSAGLCLPHLRQMLDTNTGVGAKARVLAGQQAIWSGLQADLNEFVRKHDYRYGTDAMGDEGTSPRRAVESISGMPGIR